MSLPAFPPVNGYMTGIPRRHKTYAESNMPINRRYVSNNESAFILHHGVIKDRKLDLQIVINAAMYFLDFRH